ncbi:MAG TPA: PVC-type heme-binding CxxCH protein [Isosphaeraceae bacterium]|jgi:quinoprotein glucose dehydrogenase|nr:PVC-type heme-binding CxxCH protein [Isosphaeraceae bacterium]
MLRLPRICLVLACAMVASLSPRASAQTPNADAPFKPNVVAASEEGQRAIAQFRVPKGLKVELFAAEPLLANPVAFCVDEKNRFYVAETFRLGAGVTDTRGHMNWLDDDLACRTVEDRVAMYRKFLPNEFASFGTEHDRLRLVVDTDGDGRADRSTVFADGFHDQAVGLGAGVLARKGHVYFTCIPDLWLLKDTDGDGIANVRSSLHHGYGVHVGFVGHDLHGLRFGPDGKLYFSIGDRGFNVAADGKRLAVPDTGSVLRCNPDGSELEVFATGLRNPQELAFDQFGNLFTGENNSDSGDRARFVYLVEGGDSGWCMGYQYIESPVARGPWNAERLWYPHFDGQAAYIVPPLMNLADGPSGLTYDPGTGISDTYRNHFFLADFRGSSGQSGIRSFAVKPQGAAFEVVDSTEFLWSVLATDVDFGTDGSLYFSDWVEGWGLTGKGRIYRVSDPATAGSPLLRQVKTLLAEGMDGRKSEELATLLANPDMRVRQEAQFALAEKRAEAIPVLARVAADKTSQLARLHAIWGLGQVGRQEPKAYEPVLASLADDDAEVRAQAAKVVGDGRVRASAPSLIRLLSDPSPRVRFFAAISLGKLGARDATAPLLALLRENADSDPFLRHAGVMGLVGAANLEALLEAASDSSASVRMGVVLALRRLERPEVARFLDDGDASLVLEAARAINDVPIVAAMPKLAALSSRNDLSEPLWRRVVNANVRLAGQPRAEALASIAVRGEVPEAIRTEAIEALGDWAHPSGRDRVMGLWRPLPSRPAGEAVAELKPALATLFHATDDIQEAAALAAATLGIREAAPALADLVADANRFTRVRTQALKALETLGDEHLADIARKAATSSEVKLRTEGQRVLAKLEPAEAVTMLSQVLDSGSVTEKQGALTILGGIAEPAADTTVARWLDRLIDGQVPAEIQLELLEAAAKHPAADVQDKLKRYEASRPTDDPLGAYRVALAGGDSRRGRQIFFEKAEASCLRCHKVRSLGGEVGPELTGIGTKKNREYLLESIVAPNRQIAQGFETLIVALDDGQIHSGVLKSQDNDNLTLMTAEGRTVVVRKSSIEDQKRGSSAMPEDLIKTLTKQELRDLVEFLANLK